MQRGRIPSSSFAILLPGLARACWLPRQVAMFELRRATHLRRSNRWAGPLPASACPRARLQGACAAGGARCARGECAACCCHPDRASAATPTLHRSTSMNPSATYSCTGEPSARLSHVVLPAPASNGEHGWSQRACVDSSARSCPKG